MIGRSGERWSRISVLAARHDDDDEELGTRRKTRRIDFWSSQARGELAPYEGRSRWGPNE